MTKAENELFGSRASQFHDVRGRHISIIGEVEEPGIGHGFFGGVDILGDETSVMN